MNGCCSQQVLLQNLGWFLSQDWKKLLLRGFILKPAERPQILLESSTRDFQNSPPFERSACFNVTITENFERFQYFNSESDFLENEKLLQKTEWSFLVESNKIESTSFLCKSDISEANVKTNRMTSTKWIYHKEQSFSRNHFVFFESFVSV